MKLLNKFSISPKNQLKKNIFVYIVLILFCLLLVFLLVGNLDNILRSIHETNRVETDNRAEYQAVVKLSEKLEKEHIAQAKQDTAVEKTVVWGTSTASYKAVALQLNNMKEDFRTEEQLEECAGAEILFVCKTDFNDQEIQMLEEYSRAGAALFFTEIPPKPTETPKPTEVPKPTEQPKATPTPSVPGTCPKMTPVPTKAPLASYNGGNNGGTTSGNGGSSYGNSGGYGSYQGGSMAGSSKTGDVRPFKMMAVLGLIGMGLLTGGVVIYRRTVSGKRNIKGMPRK